MNNKPDILESEKALHILKEIERDPQITQRALAQKLEVSLGKVNFLIKALIKKGIIEAKNFKNSRHKLAYMYLLTPEGMKTKFDLTHKFFAWKMQEYEKLKEEIESLKIEVTSISLKKEPV